MATPAATRMAKIELSAVTEIPTATKMAVFGDPDGNGIKLLGYMDMGSGFVPLGGTAVGKPITGNLEIEDATLSEVNKEIFMNSYSGVNKSALFFEGFGGTGYIGLSYSDSDLGYRNYLRVGDGKFTLSSDKADFKGFAGTTFFNKQNDLLAFAQLGDIAEVNATVLPLSLATLNADYATQGAGFRVCCPNLNLDYIKDTLTTWHSVATTTVV